MRISPPKNFSNRGLFFCKKGMAHRQNPFKLHGERGFSLVEALVTLFLVGVLAAMFLTFVRQGMRTSTAALHASEATSVANSLMSEILTRLNEEDSGTVHQGDRNYQWEVKILPILGEEAERVDLTIEWTEAAGPQRMTVSTLRAVERVGPTGLGSPEPEAEPGDSPSETDDSTPGPGGTGEDGPSS